jgi:peptidoglycan/LPS O-acetylase OafA/YrhL
VFAANRFELREDLPWHFFYLSNIYFFNNGGFGGPLSHLWTLAVEEQFYLFWPWVVLFFPRRYLPAVICLLIVIAPASRALIFISGYSHFAQYNTLVISNFDSLGSGALLAWAHTLASPRQRFLIVQLCWFAIPAGLALGALTILLKHDLSRIILGQLALAGLIMGAIQSLQTTVGRYVFSFLSISPLVFVGRISYGIYLYHMFAPNILSRLIRFFGASESLLDGLAGVLLMSFITIAGATFSWFAIERPLNSLKTRFPYGRPQPSHA